MGCKHRTLGCQFPYAGLWCSPCAVGDAIDTEQALHARVAEIEAERNRLRGLLREVRPFVDTNATAVVDELARRFYRDTGLMAPGKSVPMEMANSCPDDDTRRVKYREWLQVHRDAFCAAIDAALRRGQEGAGE